MHTRRVRPLMCALALSGMIALACTNSDVTATVAVASITLTPSSASLEAGRTLVLQAQPIDERGALVTSRPITYSSNNIEVATVSVAGVVSARSAGVARIAASSAGQSAVSNITVSARAVASVQLLPAALALRVNRTATLQARTLDAEGSVLDNRTVSWSSSDLAIATVSTAGVVTGVAPGAATITATSENRSAQSAITVTPEPVATVTLVPTRDTIAVGVASQLSATTRTEAGVILTDRPVAWSVSNGAVASVSSNGLVTAIAPGTAQILAVSEGRVGQATVVVVARLANAITLSPASATIAVGGVVRLVAQITDAGGNLITGRAVSFSSNAPAVATVSATGDVLAVTPGVARITALSEGKTTTAEITVIPVPVVSVVISPSSGDVLENSSRLLIAQPRSATGELLTGRKVDWISGAPGILTVNSGGTVFGIIPGTAIVAATVDGVTGFATIRVVARVVASVAVTPQSPAVVVNASVQLTATPADAAGSAILGRAVSWRSANEGIAFVTSTGRVIGVSPGTVAITATVEGVSGSTTVTVR